MADKRFRRSQLPVRKTQELLPSIFQTDANKKFMAAAVDPLVQPGSLQKLVGYVGKRFGKTYKGSDIYLDSDETLRSRYQLEPAVIGRHQQTVASFHDYLDFKNQLKFFGNNNDRDDIVGSQENYSWNPPIDWDKFVNYREYYWEPLGPPPVDVSGQSPNVISTYRVKLGVGSSYIFSPDGRTNNPTIVLYRGQTYNFIVNVPKDGFVIRNNYDTGSLTLNPSKIYFPGELAFYDGKLFRAKAEILPKDLSSIDVDSQDWEFIENISYETPGLNYDKGVTNNGIQNGNISFTVPYDAPDVLYYQSLVNPDRLGRFIIGDIGSNTRIDIEKEIIGKTTYRSSNGVEFTNNLVVQFLGQVMPTKYAKDTWLVEGVGDKITLSRFADLSVPVLSTDVPEVLFDDGGFDTQPFDDARAYPGQKDYITIGRSSLDLNPWSRYNRWFHRSIMEYAYKSRGQDFTAAEDARAKRPIIEFLPNIKLFNHGRIAKTSVDYIDDFTDDVFSKIEGSANYSVDGDFLFEGARLLITADTDSLVNNRIYEVNFIRHNNRTQIHLQETADSDTQIDDAVLVIRGVQNSGLMYHFVTEGTANKWARSQLKTKVNQPPLFDAYDENGVSFSNQETYPVSNFRGTAILSYKIGNGIIDKQLGFALSYLNIDNVGDILFSSDWDTQEFNYTISRVNFSQRISTGYYFVLDEFQNGWAKTDDSFIQPIVDSKIVGENSNNSVVFNTVDWDLFDAEQDSKIIFFVNGTKFNGTYQRTANRFLFDQQLFQNDAVSLKVSTNQPPIDGYYEIPVGLEKNPLNNDLTDFTFGQAIDHVVSGLEFNEKFTGHIPGVSNLRDIDGYRENSKRFLKHSSLIPLSIFLLCNKEYNIIKALQYAKKSYTQFKNNFLERAIELDFNANTIDFVDEIIADLTKVKNSNSAFADCEMLGTGAFTSIIYNVEDEGIKTFSLNTRFSLQETNRKSVYVYLNDMHLINTREYTFNDNFGFITVLPDLYLGDRIEIREYVSTSFSHIPPTPTKLGLYKKYTPSRFIDDTFVEPREVIQGHDGSITAVFNDFRDDLLLELELRIYNNIKIQYDEKLFDLDSTVGGYYGNSQYGKKDLDDITNQEFLRWVQNTNINYTLNEFFVENETFTYTYSNMTDPLGTSNLPGYWRGVYRWFYDTDRPHRCPWEMLGISEKPFWWDSEYGPAPYTSNNLILWEDIRDGVIRQGPRAGQYDRYKRDSILSHIPVDGDGRLLSPLDSGLANNFTLINNKGAFVLGDISPVEHAWRSSSEYPFAVAMAMCLLKPFDFISDNLDRSAVKINRLNQTVSAKTNRFIQLQDLANIDFVNELVSGLFKYIIAYVRSNGGTVTDLNEIVSNLDVSLAHKLSGFANKSQFRYLLDSKNPRSSTSNVFVPPENYEIIFNVSSPISSVSYSGVIIEKTEGGWILNGYDNINPFFIYYEAVPNQKDPSIIIGGISEKFSEWKPNVSYINGQVVKYRNDWYRALKTHESSDDIDLNLWKKLPALPLTGGVQAQRRNNFNKLKTNILSYGSKLTTIQQVVDFLLGYESYLIAIGFVFDNYDVENKSAKDWTTSSKEFMFWTRHNWAIGALITLSPASEKLVISIPVGVAGSFLDGFYDYQILKSDGKPLLPAFINVDRDFQVLTIETTDTTDGIYYLKPYFVLKENVAIFSDRTVFNDIIYDKTSGYRQERIKVQGFRTVDWDGDYTSPGFLFDNVEIEPWQPFYDYKLGDIASYRSVNWTSQKNHLGTETFDTTKWAKLDLQPQKQLIFNFDYKINQFEDYFETTSEGLGENQRLLAQHTIGYQPRDYLQNLAEDPITQFQLYQGFIREKGTANAVKKIFGKLSKSGSDSVILNEEWAFRVGQIGGIDQLAEIELQLRKDRFELDPQPVIVVDTLPAVAADQYYRVNKAEFTILPVPFANGIVRTVYEAEGKKTAGYVRLTDVEHIVSSFDDILNLNVNDVFENDHIWITFYLSSWSVLRVNQSPILIIEDAVKDGERVTLTLNRRHDIQPGDIIGVNNVENLTGFFKVSSTDGFTATVAVDESAQDPAAEFSTAVPILLLTEARFARYSVLDLQEAALLKNRSRLWIDDAGDNQWAVIEKQKLFSATQLMEYGISDPLATGYQVIYDDIRKTVIASIPNSGYVMIYTETSSGLALKQILEPPAAIRQNLIGSFGKSMAISPDGRWLVIGSPSASGITNRFRGDYNAGTVYQIEDIVLYHGKLFKAVKETIGDGSTINVYTEDWAFCDIITYQSSGVNAGYTQQGIVSIYEYQEQQWRLNSTVLSPRPAEGENFGHAVVLAVAGSRYTLAVSAPNSLNGKGRVYLYTYGTQWQHIENNRYKGIYDPGGPVSAGQLIVGRRYLISFVGDSDFTLVGAASNSVGVYFTATGPTVGAGLAESNSVYYAGDIVWSNGELWECLDDSTTEDGSTLSVDSAAWRRVDPISTQVSLPTNIALDDDGSTLALGLLSETQLAEIIKQGDKFGSSLALNRDGSILIVSAPAADGQYFANYRGIWRPDIEYIEGDTIKYQDLYHRLIQRQGESADSTTRSYNEEPVGLPWENVGDSTSEPSGKIFVYQLSTHGTYDLTQTINAGSMPLFNDLQSGESQISSGDKFGYSLALDFSGRVLLVTSPESDINFQNQGSAYVFETDSFAGLEYRLKQKIESYEKYPNEYFGQSIAISPDTSKIAVGAQNSPFASYTRFDVSTGTRFDLGRTAFVDRSGLAGGVYIYELKEDRYFLTEKLEAELAPFESFGFSVAITNSVVLVGSPDYRQPVPHGVVVAYEGPKVGTVRLFKKQNDVNSWNSIAVQQPAVDITTIRSIELYDNVNNLKIQDIDFVDPPKLKILNIAEQEIKFKTFYDPATYTQGTEEQIVDTTLAWTEKHVGQLWWNTSTVKWLHHEQSDITHRIGNIGKLAVGASIGVYEWVESVLLPSEWAELADTNEGIAQGISGQPLYPDDDIYSIKILTSPATGLTTATKYYYWVENTVIVPPGVIGRRISAAEVADLIANPAGTGTAYISFIDSNTFLLYNFNSIISTDTALLNFQFYKNAKPLNAIHNEYLLLTEGDAASLPNHQLESKWIDSLVGTDKSGNKLPDPTLSDKQKYGISVRPRQSMFVDRIAILKITIERINSILGKQPFADLIDFSTLNAADPEPDPILNLYDVVVDTDVDLITVGTARAKRAVLFANIVDGELDTVNIVDPGAGYKTVPSVTLTGDGSGARISVTLDNQGRLATAVVVSRGRKYSRLSIQVRYFSALVKSDVQSNNLWSIYSWDNERKTFFKSSTQAFNTRLYWQLIDWWAMGYGNQTRVVKEIANAYEEFSASLLIGDLLRIKEYGVGGWAIFEKITDDVDSPFLTRYQLVGREKGTIELSSALYDINVSGIGFDTARPFDAVFYDLDNSLELRNIFQAVKEDIFVNEYAVEWNSIFFTAVRFVFTEQRFADWVFKTSFLNAIHNVGAFQQKISYKNDNLASFEDYINEVKPYRTTVREYVSRYDNIENANSAVSDFDLPAAYDVAQGAISGISANSGFLDQYPWKWWKDNNGFTVTAIALTDQGAGYSTPPRVLIEGNGMGATAKAFVSNGKISGIAMINAGTGFTQTPIVTLIGGGSPSRSAKATALLGDSLARTMDLSIKFDRISKQGRYLNFIRQETFIASGATSVFDLKYAPNADKSLLAVTKNSEILLNNQYDITLYYSFASGYTELRGRLTLIEIPTSGDEIRIDYEKNIELLDSVNRIQRYYAPAAGMKGADLAQLMTGIDFGGVQVQGTTFDVSGGWDALPWFTDNWDSIESSADYYIVVDGSTTAVVLPYIPQEGQQITIYIKRAGMGMPRSIDDLQYSQEIFEPKITRIDDPDYTNDWDSTFAANPNAQMPTFVGDGSTNAIEVGLYISTNAGDILIFRPIESDGAVKINDPNILDTAMSGGSLSAMNGAYVTAAGITPEEIVVEGGKFISPDQISATEENIPGQILENVSIKVFTANSTGAAPLSSTIRLSDGISKIYAIGLKILENRSILIYVDKILRNTGNGSLDYAINLTTDTIEFVTAPTPGQTIEIFALGIGGLGLLDYQEFTADGQTNLFLTKANYSETSSIFVTVDGEFIDTNFINSADVIDVVGRTMVQFGISPKNNAVIKIIAMQASSDVDSTGLPVIRINQQEIIFDGSTRKYNLDNFVNLSRASALSSIIVEVNNLALTNLDTIFSEYDGVTNQFVLGVDPEEVPGVILPSNIKVFVNDDLKNFITDYDYDGNTKILTVSPSVLRFGDKIKIENDLRSQYFVDGNGIEVQPSVSLNENDKITVTWFSEYPSMGIVTDEFKGGRVNYRLPFIPVSVNFLWVYKNGQRMTKDVDFYLANNQRDVYLKNDSVSTDKIKIVSYGSAIIKLPSAYEITKDMRNFYYYKRFCDSGIKLSQRLDYFDDEIVLNDAAGLNVPIVEKNISGMISVNGEKIEYLEKIGNVLKKLRRGAQGTATKESYAANTTVIDLGKSEIIPYNESQDRTDFVSDGSTLLIGPLDFIPARTTVPNWYRESIPADYSICHQIEIFVGGKRLTKDQQSVYDESLAASSPAGDKLLEAEFSVDGLTPYVRLTAAPAAGTRISIITRTGKVWYDRGINTASNGKSLLDNRSSIAKFIAQRTTDVPE